MNTSVWFVLTSVAFLGQQALAFPNQPGSCASGRNTETTFTGEGPLGMPHFAATDVSALTLSNAGVTVSIDGIDLVAGQETSFPVGVALTWTVTARGDPMRGILVRLAGSDEFDATGSLEPGTSDLQVLSLCESPSTGISHNSNSDKTVASGTILVDEEVSSTALDVTVVFQNNASLSSYASAGYILTFADLVEPTDRPIAQPTLAPIKQQTQTPGNAETSTPIAALMPTLGPVATTASPSAKVVETVVPTSLNNGFSLVAADSSTVVVDGSGPVMYQCIMNNLWSASRHPADYPESAHWSPPVLIGHNLAYTMWESGGFASPGVESVVETGDPFLLKSEIEDASPDTLLPVSIGSVTFNRDVQMQTLPQITIDDDHYYLSIVSMIADSPDFFSGFYNFDVRDPSSNLETYYQFFSIESYPHDAGTEQGSTYNVDNDPEDPILPITRFTVENIPETNVFLSPDGGTVLPVARFDCTLLSAAQPVSPPVDTGISPTSDPLSDLFELLESNPDYSTLISLIQMAGLEEAVRTETITLLAPNNAAFAAIPGDALESIIADPELLGSILAYHAIPGLFLSSELQSGPVDTLLGLPLDVVVSDDALTFNGIPVIQADVVASNGVAHGIAAILNPETVSPPTTTEPPLVDTPTPVSSPSLPGSDQCKPWSFQGRRRVLFTKMDF